MSIQCPYSIGKVPNIFRFETVFMIWPLIAQNVRSVLTNGPYASLGKPVL
jgi:hypothetical protein